MTKQGVLSAVAAWLDQFGLNYNTDYDKCRIEFGFPLKDCKLRNCSIKIIFNEHDYEVYCYSPVSADTNNIGQMLEYVTRANYGLKNGNFELDVRDGEIRYKCYVTFCEETYTIDDDTIQDSVLVPIAMLSKYGDGIAALAMGFSDAKTEISKAEG